MASQVHHLRVVDPDDPSETAPEELAPAAAAESPEPLTWEDLVSADGPQDRGLALLVDMVKTGSVDPWDVDLKVVAERFMEAVEGLTTEDLPKSGRLFFYASVIIRLKAQWLAGRGSELLEAPEDDPEAYDEWDAWGDEAWDDELADALVPTGRRRRGAGEILLFPKNRVEKRRPLTIQDLLEALDKAEAHEDKMERLRTRRASGKGDAKLPFRSVKEAMDTVHQDDFARDISAAQEILREALGEGGACELAVFDGAMDRISAFLALLFLAAKGEVDLEQDEFYTPIRVKKGDPAAIARRFEPRPRFVPKKREKKKKPEAEEASPDAADAAEDPVEGSVAELFPGAVARTPRVEDDAEGDRGGGDTHTQGRSIDEDEEDR